MVSISKYKNIFAKGYVPKNSDNFFVIKKFNMKTNCKKINQKEIRILITKKDDKLCVEWKEYNNFNISIDKKVIV